jgi:hypothetical protein
MQGKRVKSVIELILEQESFYRDVFGTKYDFRNVHIPERCEGFDRIIIAPEGMTTQSVHYRCSRFFKCRQRSSALYEELYNDRDPKNGSYAIWVRDRVEADEELNNKSAIQIEREGITTETLLDRLLHELNYFWETSEQLAFPERGRHLDFNALTLCSGNRYFDGSVPTVGWRIGGLDVYGCNPGITFSDLRAREVRS